MRWDSAIPHWGVNKGYKDVVIHISLLEVVHDGVLIDLAEQHHVVHAAVFDIVALPVVPVVAPAPLQQNTHNAQLLARWERHNEMVWTNRESDIKVALTHIKELWL